MHCHAQGLRKQGGTNYCQALQQIPRNTRTMYVHSYQSRLWNAAASHRIKTYGAEKAVAGDLVLPSDDAPEGSPEGALHVFDDVYMHFLSRVGLDANACICMWLSLTPCIDFECMALGCLSDPHWVQ